jgi:hypothetical protein
LPWAGFELTTWVVRGTDCTCSCKSNYHTIKVDLKLYGVKIVEFFSYSNWNLS